MVAGNKVVYSGTGWPAADIVRSTKAAFGAYLVATGPRPPTRAVFTLATTGRGRGWEAAKTEGFWRDLGELDFDDQRAVLALVCRRGDPAGILSPREQTHTGHWVDLAALLAIAARAWEPVDASGVSCVTKDRHRLQQAKHFTDDKLALQILKDDLEVIPDPAGGLALRACTLAAFMVVSAVSALERCVPMRRCAHCTSWFELARADARFCCDSCRALNAQRAQRRPFTPMQQFGPHSVGAARARARRRR
jgi:hypothetical protein